MELDAISQPELSQIEKIGGADLVIGMLGVELPYDGNGSATTIARQALAGFNKPLRAMVVCSNNGSAPPPGGVESSGESDAPAVFSCTLPPPRQPETPQQRVSHAYEDIFSLSGRLGARACTVIASPGTSSPQQWIHRLIQPVLDLGFDLVAPCYGRQKLEGLLNRSILAPLYRALYGERLENPMGPDFGLSGKLLQHIQRPDSGRRREDPGTLASVASAAACGAFQVCESHLGIRVQRSTDWENLSALLSEILDITFLDMEARAAHWQSVRGSKRPPVFGTPETPPWDASIAEVQSMIESFQLGTSNLQDIWGLILPPTSLLELRKLARAKADEFRLPDPLWARLVYDFALGHRLRTISRDHLLRSMTPLYLGWIASFALEMSSAGPAEVEARLDRLGKAFEENKPYLVSRWRWPDRFSP